VPGSEQEIAEWWIRYFRYRFEEDREPIFAWYAYQWARADKVPIPDWVLTYLDWCAANLIAAERSHATMDPAPTAAAAIGFKRKGRTGRWNPFKPRDEGLEVVSALMVDRYIRRGAGLDATYTQVTEDINGAKHFGRRTSKRAVEAAWAKWRGAFRRSRR
jgi:hypothetical protein